MTALNERALEVAALAPCPFCGKPPIMVEHRDYADGFIHSTAIRCDDCGIEVGDEYRSEATEAWNKRAYHASEPDAVAVERAEPVAWRWKEPLALHVEGSGFAWHFATHWSTGPAHAEPLYTASAIRARSQP